LQPPHRMKGTPTYNSWKAMKKRCLNPNCEQWDRYGGRGIKVCDRWMTFANFLADMGERPNGTTLDRIDNDGSYCLENCRWATREEQANNKRSNVFIQFGDEQKTMAQLARFFGVNEKKVHKHLKRRSEFDIWTFCSGVSTPPRLLEHDGRRQSLKAWARELGICSKTLRQRLARWPLAEALTRPAMRKAT
jgi:hypothetical protein